MSFESEVARLRAISDPGARANAAAEAAQDAATVFRAVELAAMRELVDAHGGTGQRGAIPAAARELGRGVEGVRKRLSGADGTGESEPFEQEGEPGRFFASPGDAHDALLDWQLQLKDLNVRRDPLVRGALAAGLAPRIIRDTTGVSLDTIDRLESTSVGTAVDVPVEVWEETVDYLADLAPQLGRQGRFARLAARALAGVVSVPVDASGHRAPLPEALRGEEFEALSVEEKVERHRNTPWPEARDIPSAGHQDMLDGPDGWAAVFCAQMEELAGSVDADMAAAARRVAAAVRHVRLTGTLPEGDSRD
ncbi:hypothetical protein NW249_23735 [Streptomyces sp. OUCMDZ-4982]|uniref:hypothetical protein n=1 Tax=Streptomyces sp. OUCMDZ-4982 TaxID=2973090 RepID=UPI00215CCD0D|nr:hypothetical protein [Streptomyces sp. OUCMDZ-4982]MCR8945133.1 hypothetical protein [Streptomyces sp. OUCMDZ-4982]